MDINEIEYKYDTMLNEDLAKFIDTHNKWRRYRGDNNTRMCCPKELGVALDQVISRLDSYAMREHFNLEQSLAEQQAQNKALEERVEELEGYIYTLHKQFTYANLKLTTKDELARQVVGETRLLLKNKTKEG